MAVQRAIFLDRDGVILEHPKDTEKGYIYKSEHIKLLPGVREALAAMSRKGYLLVVISNQSAIADGFITPEGVEALQKQVNEMVGGVIDRFYFCPHHPRERDNVPEWAKQYRVACECRKPAPGMLVEASRDLDIDLAKSWLIGDMISDIAAGKAAGCRTIMVESPHSAKVISTAQPFDTRVKADFQVRNLEEGLMHIS